MDDDLLKFYSKELNYLRQSAAAFARENPAAAARLRISQDAIEDPHVERLIQSVAFLNGRTRKKLDDEFPELTEAYLNVLYPHYLNPIPAMSVVRMQPDKGLAEDYHLPKGTLLETQPVEGDPVTFRTAYPVTLWPFDISRAELVEGAYKAPPIPSALNPTGIIRIELQTFAEDILFSGLKVPKLRFFLRGDNSIINPLYQLLFNNVCAVALANDPYDPDPVYLGPDSIKPVGFESADGLLDYSRRSSEGYRLLTEYFAFPQKFYFFDLDDLHKKWKGRKSKIEIYFYLNKAVPDLNRGINRDTFALGCAPVVNLFTQRAEPVILDGKQEEYHLIADARNLLHKEIVSIDTVTATNQEGKEIKLHPFYGFTHTGLSDDSMHWYATRKPAPDIDPEHIDRGTEMYLTIADDNYFTQSQRKWILNAHVTCSNRDLPKRLPYGGGQPNMFLREGGLVERIDCLIPPTATKRPSAQAGRHWRLISHLTISHLSSLGGKEGVAALREMLLLYDFDDSEVTRSIINSITDISFKQIASRVRAQANTALCRGLEVTLTIDESRFKDQSLFLFGSVLERFFGLGAPLNSFTKLVIKTKRKSEIFRKWKPRAAHHQLA